MKTLTTLFFALGLLLSTLLTSAQSKADKIYDSFDNKDGVTSFTFTKEMTDAFNIDLGDDGDEKNVTGDLHKIRFMSYNPGKGIWSGDEFLKKAVSMLPSQYEKYVDDDDEDSDTEIWLLGKKKKYTECHVFVHNDNPQGNSFIVSFYGDFTVNDLEGLKATGKGMSK
jgi:hypothetical protein